MQDICVHISGGLENGKHLIITFPDVGLRQLESSESFSELLTTLVYFKTLIRCAWWVGSPGGGGADG